MRQQPARQQTALRAVPQEMRQQRQEQPRAQAPAPQKQEAPAKAPEQRGNRKKPPEE
jgi:hypothetical protein